MDSPPFLDRRDAGRKLGAALALLGLEQPIVLGIARGGVIVAEEVARRLDAELGVATARKLGAPGNAELGIGAVTARGSVVLDSELVRETGATEDYLRQEVAAQREEARRRLEAFGNAGEHNVHGRSVILVDDGIATGVTAKAALRGLRQEGAAFVVVAVPCAPPLSLDGLREEADTVVSLIIDHAFVATGQYYVDFRTVSDGQVRAALEEAATRRRGRVSSGGERLPP